MAHTRVEEIKEKYTFALARMQTTFDRKSAFFDIDDVEWLIKEVEALRRAEVTWAEKFKKMGQLEEELEEYLSDVRFRLSKILYHITDGSFSQPTYPADLMISWIDDAFMRTVDRETKALRERLEKAEVGAGYDGYYAMQSRSRERTIVDAFNILSGNDMSPNSPKDFGLIDKAREIWKQLEGLRTALASEREGQ